MITTGEPRMAAPGTKATYRPCSIASAVGCRPNSPRTCRHVVICEGFQMPPRRIEPRALAAGVRKPPKEETAMRERVWVRRALWGSERCGNERAITAPDPEAAGGSAGMPAV